MRKFLIAAIIVATLGAVAPAPPQDSADLSVRLS
jgi:hypothetical protein